MGFKRWSCSWDRTAAFWLFRAHHTQLNEFYWAHAPAARFIVQAASSHPQDALTADVFSDRTSDAERPAPRIGEWAVDYRDFLTWTRLNVAVSIVSNLEMYLRMAVARALESDPGTMIGAPHAADGVALLKEKPTYSYATQAAKVTEGDWQKRIRTYESYFGKVPSSLSDEVGELDSLRRLRNGVAHMFGREMDAYKTGLTARPQALQALSEDRLKKWFGLVERVALTVDEHLRNDHIGEYEALLHYHQWRAAYKGDPSLVIRNLRASFRTEFGLTVSRGYCESLASYYKSA